MFKLKVQSVVSRTATLTFLLLCLGYLDHGNVFLWGSWLNLARHLDHSFDQPRHVLVHLVIRSIQIGGGRRAYLLGLQLNDERTKSNEWQVLMCEQRPAELSGERHRRRVDENVDENN